MHIHKLEQWQHGHNFFVHREQNEKNTQKVMGLTAVTMVIEIVAGVAFGSMWRITYLDITRLPREKIPFVLGQ